MAYTDRAPRWIPAYSSTGPNVAPNSYQTIYDDYCSCRGTNWAPFLSCAPRTKDKTDSDTPAPNAYYPKSDHKIIGGASLLYTAPRSIKRPLRPKRIHRTRVGPKARLKGFMYHCQVPYSLLGYPPTIPNIGHIGYKSLGDESLVECCDPNNDITLGPAFYKLNFDTFGTWYRGSYWSRYSGRKAPKMSDGPGVGTYNIVREPSESDDYLNKLRQERKRCAASLRYADQLQMHAIRDNFPAPNQYMIQQVKCWKTKRKLVPKKLIRTRRILPKTDTGPAPNQYNNPRSAFESMFKPSCKKGLSAFLTTATRFKEEFLEEMPGPNTYKLPTFVDELKKKVSPYAVRDTAFDSSVPKKSPPPERRPPPVEIWDESPPPPPFRKPPQPIKAERFKMIETYEASPASYDIRKAFAFATLPRSHRKVSRYDFLYTAARFTNIPSFFAVEDKSYIPGHIYDLEIRKPCRPRKRVPGSFYTAKRFRAQEKSIYPGPSSYDTRANIRPRTYNVKLMDQASLTTPQINRMKLRGIAVPQQQEQVKKKLKSKQESPTCIPRGIPTVTIEFAGVEGQLAK